MITFMNVIYSKDVRKKPLRMYNKQVSDVKR